MGRAMLSRLGLRLLFLVLIPRLPPNPANVTTRATGCALQPVASLFMISFFLLHFYFKMFRPRNIYAFPPSKPNPNGV
ncbi:unnamed protein product [Nyctereutes procyonoides]|uniref:(raccoon dog) hypothetical protein n=1 Tax=Nyctereutes procyonoides TaxID=34880 RepID=A0A811ZQP6_NYCPR|nr:unnamed protein product [Nyctereutes procyonoides]